MPWCDIHPTDEHTSKFDIEESDSPILFAYRWQDMTRVPAADITLQKGSMYLDQVQGGFFTDRGRVILSRRHPNRVHCYSALNGHYFGGRELDEIDSEARESRSARGILAHPKPPCTSRAGCGPRPERLHLHSYGVPDPGRL